MNAYELESRLEKAKEHTHPCAQSEIGYLTLPLFIVSQKLYSNIAKLFEQKYNLSNSEADVLGALSLAYDQAHTLSPTKLYENLFFSSGGMTKVLHKLEAKGYIIRLDNPHDRRSKLVQITPEGKKIFEQAIVEVHIYEEEVFSHLSQQEQQQLSKLLLKSLKNL